MKNCSEKVCKQIRKEETIFLQCGTMRFVLGDEEQVNNELIKKKQIKKKQNRKRSDKWSDEEDEDEEVYEPKPERKVERKVERKEFVYEIEASDCMKDLQTLVEKNQNSEIESNIEEQKLIN